MIHIEVNYYSVFICLYFYKWPRVGLVF